MTYPTAALRTPESKLPLHRMEMARWEESSAMREKRKRRRSSVMIRAESSRRAAECSDAADEIDDGCAIEAAG